VANCKLNTLYIGIDNPLFIAYNYKKNFILKCNKGKIEKRNERYYVTKLFKPGPCLITLTDLNGHNQESFEFLIRYLPAPIGSISSKRSNDEINKSLLVAGCIIPFVENFDIEIYYKVLSYQVLVTRKNNEISKFSAQSSCLTSEMKTCFQNLETGDNILFYSIKCKLVSEYEIPEQEILPISLTIE